MQNIFHAKVNDSTLDDVTGEEDNRRRRMLSLSAILAVAALVLVALFGVFERKATATAQGEGFGVQVEYQQVARAGNEVELRVVVTSESELPETIMLELNEDYLKFFEDFAAFPDPEAQTANGQGAVEFELSPTPGSRQMAITLIGRASDAWEPAAKGLLRITVDGAAADMQIRTWRIP